MTNDRLGSDELAAREPARVTTSAAEAADLQDKYDRMLRLADLFDRSADELRTRAGLGEQILHDDAVTDSAELSKLTYTQAENDLRSATTGKNGLLSRGIELDADALMVRTTVLTYRWIDELQDAAYKTLGSIAGRAIGYLAPEIALGGAVVSAGLIETDALDRDGVAAYLSELAENNPELMDHVTSGGGGLLDGLQMRSVLTVGVMAGETGGLAARGGLRAMGLPPMETDFGSAVRDVAGGFVAQTTLPPPKVGALGRAPQPRGADDHARRVPGQRGGTPDRRGPLHRLPPRPGRQRPTAAARRPATTRRTPARSCARSRRPSATTRAPGSSWSAPPRAG